MRLFLILKTNYCFSKMRMTVFAFLPLVLALKFYERVKKYCEEPERVVCAVNRTVETFGRYFKDQKWIFLESEKK